MTHYDCGVQGSAWAAEQEAERQRRRANAAEERRAKVSFVLACLLARLESGGFPDAQQMREAWEATKP